MNDLFPTIPDGQEAAEYLAGLTAEELDALFAGFQAGVDRVEAHDTGEMTRADVIAAMRDATTVIDAIRTEQVKRGEADAAEEAELAELTAKAKADPAPAADADADADTPAATGGDDEDDDEGDPEPAPADEPVADADAEKPELVTAAVAEAELKRRSPKFARAAAATPRPASAQRRFLARGDLPGHSAGEALTYADALQAIITKNEALAGAEGKFSVVRVNAEYPEDRRLDRANPEQVQERIKNAASPEAITAAGGLCAPVTPYYDLMICAVEDRPVRDSLVGFQATRGGITLAPPPTLANVTTAVTRLTETQDQAGGTSATKGCQTVACPSFVETDVAIIARCLRFGNLGSRAWPEQVDAWLQLTAAYHARVAETALLDGIAAASTAVTGAAVGGAISTLLGQILQAAAGMRSRQRMRADQTLRVILPAWTADMLVADLTRSAFGRFELNQAGVQALLGTYRINVTWTLDGATGAGQVFGAQGAGALIGFPDTVRWYLFPEGAFLFLDGGTLDLGVVRDSTLNSTNDYQLFMETFENVAYAGCESLQVTSDVCASGQTIAPATLSTCSGL